MSDDEELPFARFIRLNLRRNELSVGIKRIYVKVVISYYFGSSSTWW